MRPVSCAAGQPNAESILPNYLCNQPARAYTISARQQQGCDILCRAHVYPNAPLPQRARAHSCVALVSRWPLRRASW